MDESSYKELIERLSYDPSSGLFFWKIKRKKVNPGDKAGSVDGKGYVKIVFRRKRFSAHRLAWIYFHGSINNDQHLDHINGNRSDNRMCNLRIATQLENVRNKKMQHNNKSGFKGVCRHKKNNNFVASIGVDNKNIHLGCFSTAEEAHAAYCEAATKLFGAFANFGTTS